MKFTSNTAELIEHLSIVTKALSSRTTNPILEGILIQTSEDGIVLTCSDERITIVSRMPAKVQAFGQGVVPGKLFTEIIKRLPDPEVTVTMNNNFSFNIRSGASTLNIAGQDAVLFPQLPQLDNPRVVRMPQPLVKKMIQKTEFAIAPEDMREILTGCYLEIEEGGVKMVGLDGYRMAIFRARSQSPSEKFEAIIPGRAVGEIARLLSDNEDKMTELSLSGNKLHITIGSADIYVILIGGQYINYRQIIPQAFATHVMVSTEAFSRAIDRASLIAREGNNNLVILRIHDDVMDIDAHSQIGDVHEEIAAELNGNALNIAFNVRYLIDVIRSLDSDKIEMNFNTAITPCVIYPDDTHDYMHLVLPVRTSETV